MASKTAGIIFVCLFQSWVALVSCQSGTIVPLYLYPVRQGAEWQALIDAKTAHPTVEVWAIANVDSGPSNGANSDYTPAIQRLVDAKINVMGYIPTRYGDRPQVEVTRDIDKWLSYYPGKIRGIFFDEMAYQNTSYGPAYYRFVNNYAKQKGISFTVGNPGTDTDRAYVDTVDTIIIYETDKGFPSETQYGGWHTAYERKKWGILPYNIPSLNVTQVTQAKKTVKWIHVTDDKLDNPWDSLPNYLPSLFSALE